MNEVKTFKPGEIIIRQGDPGDCMFSVQGGNVGVYSDYGTPNEKKLSELVAGDFFGEMSLLDHAPRSATVVVLQPNTFIEVITEDNFKDYFGKSPEVVMNLTMQMCHRLRNTTRKYVEAVHTAVEAADTPKEQKSKGLLERIRRLRNDYLQSK